MVAIDRHVLHHAQGEGVACLDFCYIFSIAFLELKFMKLTNHLNLVHLPIVVNSVNYKMFIFRRRRWWGR